MECFISFEDDEEELFKSYASSHGMSLSEAFKKALLEKIEDEYDIALAEATYKEYLKNPQTISFEEIMKENDITEEDLKNYENIELE